MKNSNHPPEPRARLEGEIVPESAERSYADGEKDTGNNYDVNRAIDLKEYTSASIKGYPGGRKWIRLNFEQVYLSIIYKVSQQNLVTRLHFLIHSDIVCPKICLAHEFYFD